MIEPGTLISVTGAGYVVIGDQLRPGGVYLYLYDDAVEALQVTYDGSQHGVSHRAVRFVAFVGSTQRTLWRPTC